MRQTKEFLICLAFRYSFNRPSVKEVFVVVIFDSLTLQPKYLCLFNLDETKHTILTECRIVRDILTVVLNYIIYHFFAELNPKN